ncbi:MAG: tetratricopeptide repeat protein [Chthonomonas sp.]|nr:tetratricopeptide repeat protein [Chthonomonas sp.]
MLLVTCSECEKPNTLDSQFCRSCGHALPEEALADAREANNELVENGLRLLGDGRSDEAFLVACEALEADPSHVQALSLKGDALERQGKLADALACYERVAELSPNSPLDRIKVEHVRRMLSEAPTPVTPNKRAALGAAVAATALVACIGITSALMINRAQAATVKEPIVNNVVNTPGTTSGQQKPSDPLPQAKEVSREEYERLRQQAAAQQPTTGPNTTASTNRPGSNNQLPNPSSNGRTDEVEGGIGPLRPPMNLTPVNQNPSGSNSNSTNSQQDPDPTPTQSDPQPTTQSNPGTVDIRPTPGNTTQVGGSEVIGDSGPTWRDHTIRARQFFNSGDYAKAAKAYEDALAAGAEPASTNQRLGQCYQRLGRRADAKRAYENAVRYFTAQVQASPDSPTLRSALQACQQALKSLG